MSDLVEKLLSHGVFALVAVAEGFVILYLYRQLEKATDRLVAKAEKDAEKNSEFAARSNAMVQALLARAKPETPIE